MSAIQELEKTVLALPVKQRVVLAESRLDSLPPAGEDCSEAEELAAGPAPGGQNHAGTGAG